MFLEEEALGFLLSLRFPLSYEVPFSVSLKEGQLLEVVLQEVQGKWKIQIPYSQIYEEIDSNIFCY